MNTKYEPKRKEVLAELVRNSADYLKNKDTYLKPLRCIGKVTYNIALGAALTSAGLIAGFISSYIAPTTIRYLYGETKAQKHSNKHPAEDVNWKELLFGTFGFIGFSSNILNTTIYLIASDHYRNNKIMLLPLATNIASGVFEYSRVKYNKAKQKLIKQNSLDSIIQEESK